VKDRVNATRFAGSWYPNDAARLAEVLRGGAAGAPRDGNDRTDPLLAILPHAGLAFSARGQRAFWDRNRNVSAEAVVVIAPSHYTAIGVNRTAGAAFSRHETPMGWLEGLPVCLGDREEPETLVGEHAVELLLPGIRCFCEDTPVGALLTGGFSSTHEVRAAAARVLDRVRESSNPDRVLWLVSSDFTHYGARFGYQPFGSGPYGRVGSRVAERDRTVAEAAATGELDRFWGTLEMDGTVCGRFAIALALAVLEQVRLDEPRTGRLLSYYTSADLAGNPDREENFVCYATVEVATP
jgi:MEMO1 family protein